MVLFAVVAIVAAVSVAWILRPQRGEVLVIGDSLTLLARDQGLRRDGWDVDARAGRRIAAGIEVAKTEDADRYPVVIVALGSNDRAPDPAAYGTRIDQMMDVIGPEPEVVWVNVDTMAPGLADAAVVNEALRDAADVYPNLRVGDWDSYVRTAAGDEPIRTSDGIHYDTEGSRLRAQWTLLEGSTALAEVRAAEENAR